jgi:GntR family transcriptional regulator
MFKNSDSIRLNTEDREPGIRPSAVPLWAQVERTLRQLIQTGQYKVGDQIPPEDELASMFGVSRMTVRQAVQRLAEEGQLTRSRGRGTFVATPPLSRAINTQYLDGFFATLQAQGHTIISRVLAFERISADDTVAAALTLAPGVQVYRLERLRSVDGEPVSIQTTYLPVLVLPGLQQFDFERTSLYKVLKGEYNFQVVAIDQKISAREATAEQASLLEVSPGSALLYVVKVSRTADNLLIEYGELYFLPSRYQLTMSIRA